MSRRKNTSIDMTRGPIAGPLVLFILPLIGTSIFQILYNTVDFLFVGNFLDKTAAAAVGASATLVSCTVGLFTGISVGTSVVAAQAIGAGKKQKAEDTIHTSAAFGAVGGVVIMLIAMIFAPAILRALNTPEQVIPQALVYLRIYVLGVPATVVYNMIAGGMRAYGNSEKPFRVLCMSGILNVLLDALFVVVLPFGVAGVSAATAISQTVAAILIIYMASRKENDIRFSLSKLKIDLPLLGNVLKIGLPSGIQTIIVTISNIFVQYYINDFGETAVAAFATYYKVECLIYIPILAFGQAATTFAGQNLGAGHFKRIRRGVTAIAVFGSAIICVLSFVILHFRYGVFGWFMKDGEVVENALRIAGVTFPLYFIYPIMETAGGAVRGMGHSLASMIIVIVNMCVIRVSLLAYFSAHYHTIEALARVYPITWAGAMVCFIIVFAVMIGRLCRTESGGGDLPRI